MKKINYFYQIQSVYKNLPTKVENNLNLFTCSKNTHPHTKFTKAMHKNEIITPKTPKGALKRPVPEGRGEAGEGDAASEAPSLAHV